MQQQKIIQQHTAESKPLGTVAISCAALPVWLFTLPAVIMVHILDDTRGMFDAQANASTPHAFIAIAWRGKGPRCVVAKLVLGVVPAMSSCMTKTTDLTDPALISGVIEMALSDHASFSDIRRDYGLSDAQVKTLMRENLRAGSYRAWRKRVRDFGDRRETYK